VQALRAEMLKALPQLELEDPRQLRASALKADAALEGLAVALEQQVCLEYQGGPFSAAVHAGSAVQALKHTVARHPLVTEHAAFILLCRRGAGGCMACQACCRTLISSGVR
jgi:hypothetical protein